ncbi:cell envelope-associated transcriptional attenuator lytr-cpsa-psr, subfamily m [hydrocarbon metagenome]|uniref:Cell envelope-associated transcriptional attenuator lytr-cpsa-psr, subfamily m n=1 Tax=hydrocarbon metagenome TaxID=938273 RepID=A0A0W8E262_9ZZZZ
MQKRKHISKVGLVSVVLVVYLVTFAIGTLIGNQLQNGTMVSTVQGIIPGGRLNILFMGIDARSSEENSRSDTMILASIDKRTKKAVMVWIPRDTRVEVSNGYYDKINSVNYLKGPEEACRVTGELLGINVRYYVVTNFDGFAEIVDILGGVHIDVESNMYHADPDPKLNINLSKGMQLLSGEDALRYVRYRGGPTADIGRTQRQAKFIKALIDEMISTSTITKLPELVPKLLENVHTNIPLKEMGTLANMARNFSGENMITQTLPGYSYTDPVNGASYWHADEEKTPGMIDALFAGDSFEVMSDPPGWKAPSKSQPLQETTEPEESTEIENPEDLIDPTDLDPALDEDNPEGTNDEDGSDADELDEEVPTDETEDDTEDGHTGSEGYEVTQPEGSSI